ncbi:WD domain, G-beta repeat-containing protein, putative [Eimeria tenella]|uniref:Cilia- and flagella-associated protein 52 n=1 Tax=Eimeria tenella TaxID=5802 RepID=U6KKY1_EIMTE|nr:WD domain, G-beta repeat-containing protein, putative [Eimeria tenella]CDJ37466.1 WD domain, G-beta repeat-containing protein, putative [Eimeria tenella]|eukprot:XP_013228304.1 WD domain, G-beta repeat-containing protein, putative [Eimeria tenella]
MEGKDLGHLKLDAVIGINGGSKRCILMHPDNQRLIFALGYSIVVRDLISSSDTFLCGHDNCVTCIAISKGGKYLASGQVTHPGFVADIIIWSLDDAREIGRLSFHKVSVECLDFSCDGKFLASLGGESCNTLMLWSVEERKALCGIAAALETAKCLAFYNNTPNMLVSAGASHLRIWEIDAQTKKMTPRDCNLGKLRRCCEALVIHPADEMVYCGTQSGDILEVSLSTGLFKRSGPPKRQLRAGVTAMTLIGSQLFAGTEDGQLFRLGTDTLSPSSVCQISGAVTSLIAAPDSSMLWAATSANNLYRIDARTLTPHLKHSAHAGTINQVAFPDNCSQILATCSASDVRIWDTRTYRELLRIQLPGVECLCTAFAPDGSSIITGWKDGRIRAFTPETGKLLFCIEQAHKDGVTAVAATRVGRRLASGGVSGQFRVWDIHSSSQEMLASRKEHRGKICCLRLRRNNIHALTAAEDGTIIVWDMTTYTSVLSINESTIFRSATYCADEVHILATGSDRKVHYFDALDGTKIRDFEVADDGDVHCISYQPKDHLVCTGGDDRSLRLWGYESGECIAQSGWHADIPHCVCFSPDGNLLVSGGNGGVIHFWHISEELLRKSSEIGI